MFHSRAPQPGAHIECPQLFRDVDVVCSRRAGAGESDEVAGVFGNDSPGRRVSQLLAPTFDPSGMVALRTSTTLAGMRGVYASSPTSTWSWAIASASSAPAERIAALLGAVMA